MKAVNYESIVKSMTDERDHYLTTYAIKRRVEAGEMGAIQAIREYMLMACHCYKRIYIGKKELASVLGISEKACYRAFDRLLEIGEMWQESNESIIEDDNGIRRSAHLWRLKGNSCSGIFDNTKVVNQFRKRSSKQVITPHNGHSPFKDSTPHNENITPHNGESDKAITPHNENITPHFAEVKNAIQQASVEPSANFARGIRVLKDNLELKENGPDGKTGNSTILKDTEPDKKPKAMEPRTKLEATKTMLEDWDDIRERNRMRSK